MYYHKLSFHAYIALVTILVVEVSSQEYGTTLTLKPGLVIGRILKTSNGRDFYAFRGIPYATPPLGLLRFKVSYWLLMFYIEFMHNLKWEIN